MGTCEPWSRETKKLNNFESWLVLLVPNPGATTQESADSWSAAPEGPKGSWSCWRMNCDWNHGRTHGPQVERQDVQGRVEAEG